MNKNYSVREAAKMLGYSANSIYSFLKRGELKGVRVGKGKYKISQKELDRFTAEKPEEEVKTQEPLVLQKPRTGMSLAEISNDQPLRTAILWLQERVGLPKLFDWLVGLSSIVLGPITSDRLGKILFFNRYAKSAINLLQCKDNP